MEYESVISEIVKKVEANSLVLIVIIGMISFLLWQFKDIIGNISKTLAEAFVKRKEMQLSYDELAQEQKFKRENMTAEALAKNADSLRDASVCLRQFCERCERHGKLVEKVIDQASIENSEKTKILEVVKNKDV